MKKMMPRTKPDPIPLSPRNKKDEESKSASPSKAPE
jgi:hypothetical protein